MTNGLQINDATYNLPPPGGGLLDPSASDDDTTNGNGPRTMNDGIGHALNPVHTFPSDRLPNGDDSARPSTSSSIAVGGARPKVKSFHAPKQLTSSSKEASVERNPPGLALNGYVRPKTNSEDIYDDPPSYEAAMAMANSSHISQNVGNEFNCRGTINGNSGLLNGKNNYKHSYSLNATEVDSVPNGNTVELLVDNEEFSEFITNDETNESDTDDEELNEEDEELTADLPKSFYILDVGSDSEGGNCTNQGVSRAGQSNLSSEVAKLLIQSEMVAQQSLRNGNRRRLVGNRPNARRLQGRGTNNGTRSTPNAQISDHMDFNGIVESIGENEIEGSQRNPSRNITPDEEIDFLEMDFEPNDSDDSDDSGDSGRGADETTDGNDAAEDLDDFIHDHGFGAPVGAIGDNSHSNLPVRPETRERMELINKPDDHIQTKKLTNENSHTNSESIQRQNTEFPKVLDLPLAVTTNLSDTIPTTCVTGQPQEHYSNHLGTEVSNENVHLELKPREKQNPKPKEKLNDSSGKVIFTNGINDGITSAPLQSPAGRINNNEDFTTASIEAHEMAMVRSRSLNSSLSSTLRRATNSLNSCINSPCLLMKALAKTSDSDPGNNGGIAEANRSHHIKRRHISDNASALLGTESLEVSPTSVPQNLPENQNVDMEVCGARLFQRETLVFGVPHTDHVSDSVHNISLANLLMRNSISSEHNRCSPGDPQVRFNIDPFQELSWISSTLPTLEVQESSGDNDSSQQESPVDDIQQNIRIRETLLENQNVLSLDSIPNINSIEKIMIWNEVEACKRQINQVGASACGATAVINVLQALEWPHDIDDVISAVPTRFRLNTSPVTEYLLSRSRAGTNHQDLIDAMRKITNDEVYGRFFHMYPMRKIGVENPLNDDKSDPEVGDLTRWLGKWISKGK